MGKGLSSLPAQYGCRGNAILSPQRSARRRHRRRAGAKDKACGKRSATSPQDTEDGVPFPISARARSLPTAARDGGAYISFTPCLPAVSAHRGKNSFPVTGAGQGNLRGRAKSTLSPRSKAQEDGAVRRAGKARNKRADNALKMQRPPQQQTGAASPLSTFFSNCG